MIMRKTILKLVRAVVPASWLRALFPARFVDTPADRRFVTIKDSIAGKQFSMLLREDSMMERFLISKGLYGEWEKESLKIWAQLAKQSHTIIDIGANTGVYALVAKNNNPTSVVVAIEPIDVNHDVLVRNIRENGFDIATEKVALSDTEGTAAMFMLKDRLNYMTSVNENRYAGHPEIQGDAEVVEIHVPLKPFTYVSDKHELKQIDLVKIDVEGHEITVLNGMMPAIRESKPVILIEVIGNEHAQQLDAMFSKLDYRYVSIDESGVSKVADRLWDNNHHNFLICHESTIAYLRGKGLVA